MYLGVWLDNRNLIGYFFNILILKYDMDLNNWIRVYLFKKLHVSIVGGIYHGKGEFEPLIY